MEPCLLARLDIAEHRGDLNTTFSLRGRSCHADETPAPYGFSKMI